MKENLLVEKCQLTETVQEKHENFNLHKALKEAAGVYRQTRPMVLKDEAGRLLLKNKDICKT